MSYYIANWKLNGSVALVDALAEAVPSPDQQEFEQVVICPPFPYLHRAREAFDAVIAIGGQDCSAHAGGAHTGEVSAKMLAELGASYVILGHSERREQHGETSALVAEKAQHVIEAGLVPVICIGETLAQREAGQAALEGVLAEQLAESIPASAHAGAYLIAYEPIWAIGTGKVPTLEEIAATHRFIKQQTSGVAVLYGGSVKPNNMRDICALDEVDGVLVGGASIDPESFTAMLRS